MRTLLDPRPTKPPTSPSGQVDDSHDEPHDGSRGERHVDSHGVLHDGPGDEPRDGSRDDRRDVVRDDLQTGRHDGRTGGASAVDVVARPTHRAATVDAGPGVDERCDAEEPDELHVRRRLRAARPRTDWRPVARGRHLQAVVQQASRAVRGELREAGMATAEYAIATLAAVGFAGLLVVILKGNEVRGLLMGIVRQALSL